MADIKHGVMVAVGVQSAPGVANPDIVLLTGTTVDVADGIILGDLESGDDGTGITLPQFVRQAQELPDIENSFTKRPSQFTRVTAEGLAISFSLKGNGAVSTPAADEAKPLKGIDALYEGVGLLGETGGAAPEWDYNPNPGTTYVTIRLWNAGQSWVFVNCLVETLTIPATGGETCVITASVRVGAVLSHELLALPTATWGTMEGLTPPIVENVGFTWGANRGLIGGYGELTIEVANTIEEIPDSNQDDGLRLSQSTRQFNVSGTIWMDDSDPDFEYQQVTDGVPDGTPVPHADATFRLGTAAGAGEVINGVDFTLGEIELTSVNYAKAGAYTQAVIEGHCTSSTADTEFNLTFD